MVKKSDASNDDSVRYLGEQVDPALQEKVKDYMEYESEPKQPEPSAAEEPEPLLPADKLPISITIRDDDDATEATETTPEPPVTPEPDPVAAALAPVTPSQPSAPELPSAPPVVPEENTDSTEESEEPAPDEKVEEIPDEPEVVDTEDENDLDPIEEPEAEPEAPEPEPAPSEPELPEPEPEVHEDELGLETVQTAKAVEEIVAHEADEVLAAEDEKKHVAAPIAAKKKAVAKKKKGPRARKIILIFLLIILLAVGAVAATPAARYEVLNSAGVRASTSVRVLDNKTGQPLKNVELSVGDRSAKTDANGDVTVTEIKLGPQTMTIKKPAFAEQSRTVTFGWGSNPLGEYKLDPTGSQYSLVITDFLSGLPIANADVTFGESSARTNEKGEAILTVPAIETDTLEPQITAATYRTEKPSIPANQKEPVAIAMAPARSQAFVSKRSGTFDLYKIDVDGKNETKLLPGTGLEREDALAVATHHSKNIVAFMSTRENMRTPDGVLLSVLQIINLDTGEQTRVTQSERIQIVDWVGDRLVYVKVTEGAAQESKDRHKIIAYDVRGGGERELASTNYFNDVLSANGAIYYSPAMFNVNGSVGLFKINADGTDKKSLYQKEVWNLFRTGYETVSASIGQEWFDLTLSNDALVKAPGPPSMLKSRVYVTSPAGNKSLWIDERDGKSTLIVYDHTTKKDTVLRSQSGVKTPLRWLSDQHVVYRVANGDETADYVMSLSGGEPKKIVDVTNTLGVDRWYYY